MQTTQARFPINVVPAAAVQNAVAHKPSRDDLIRHVKTSGNRQNRHTCIIVVREGVTGFVAPGGYVLSGGTHEIVVDASEVETLKSLVETETAVIEASRKRFMREVEVECDKRHGGHGWRSETRPLHEREALFEDGLKRTVLSPEKFFYDVMKRGVLPLASCEVGPAEGPIPLDTDANPVVVSAIATAAAQAALAANQATQAADKSNQKR